MESTLTIDLKTNPDVLDDFEGMEPGDKVKVVAEYTISELSERRASLPLDSIVSITGIGNDEDEDDDEEETEDSEPEGDEES